MICHVVPAGFSKRSRMCVRLNFVVGEFAEAVHFGFVGCFEGPFCEHKFLDCVDNFGCGMMMSKKGW